ncbi:hypothetical protein Tco_1245823 [Tanacetum coccineum]
MNSRYTALVASNTRLREKIKHKVGYLSELRSEISILEEKHEKLRGQLAEVKAVAARSSDELACTDVKLSDQTLVVRDLENDLALERSKSQEYRDVDTTSEHCFDDLRSEVTHFVGFGVDCLIRKLLSSDKFNATLARILSLGITSDVERGLRMMCTDAEFEEASQNVSNFFLGAKAEFNKVVVALSSTHFPFLTKIAKAVECALLEVVSIQPDKVARSTMPTSAPATSLHVGETFSWTSAMKESELPGLVPDVSPSWA